MADYAAFRGLRLPLSEGLGVANKAAARLGYETRQRVERSNWVASSLSRESERHPMKRLSQRGWLLG